MTAIAFKFIAGRYHATPWGRHVNEGAVEWPPSPWRILRAIIAAWKRTRPDLPQAQVEPILRALAGPPEFILPPASTGHTRHYMPWFKKGLDDRTLVFDAFVALPKDAELIVLWPNASLEDGGREVLSLILCNLNTLGRSESWCEAKLLGSDAAQDPKDTQGRFCKPYGVDALQDHEIIRLLCPDPDSAFEDDRVVNVVKKTTGRGKNKQTIEERSTVYDPAWNICMETLQLHEERWSDPPGSRWVKYARPRDYFKIEPRPMASCARSRPRIQVARYALDSTVLPLVTETLPVAEALRRALMSIYGRLTERNGERGRSPVFSGKDENGQPLGGHGHAYYLPTDEDGDGRLDHLTVFARGGFGDAERRALDLLRELRAGRKGEERHPLRVLLLGMGAWEEYHPGPLARSACWVSATPYLATRHAKTRGKQRIDMGSPEARAAFLEDDLRGQLAAVSKDLAECAQAVTIGPLWDDNDTFKIGGRWRPIQFKRFRAKAGDDGGRRLAGAFRLTFTDHVAGPLALGHSSHFGIGLFVPEKNSEDRGPDGTDARPTAGH